MYVHYKTVAGTFTLNSQAHEFCTQSVVQQIHIKTQWTCTAFNLSGSTISIELKTTQCKICQSYTSLAISNPPPNFCFCITLSLQTCMKLFTQMQIQSWQSSECAEVSQWCRCSPKHDNLQVQPTWSMAEADCNTPWWWMEEWRSS